MARPNSWANIRNSDIALIRRARGLPVDDLNSTSQYMNLTPEDVQYIARLRGRQYDPRFSPLTNLRGDDIDFIRNMGATTGVTQPQQFANSGSPYVGGQLGALSTPNVVEQGILTTNPIVFGSGQVTPEVRNKAIQDRLNGSRNANSTSGLDPSLPSFQPQGPVNYTGINSTSPSGVYPFTAGVGSPEPLPEQEGALRVFQNKVRTTLGLPKLGANQGNPANPPSSTPPVNAVPPAPAQSIEQMIGPAPAYPAVSADQIMRQLMVPGGTPSGGSMADARAQEIAYANSQSNPAARGGGGGSGAGVPMPPTRPEEFGSRPILYNVDFGDGSPVRQFLAKDGMAPNIPGANVYADQSYDPNAGALAKFIRGVF